MGRYITLYLNKSTYVDYIEIHFLVFEMHYIDFNVCLKCNVKNVKHVSTMQNVRFQQSNCNFVSIRKIENKTLKENAFFKKRSLVRHEIQLSFTKANSYLILSNLCGKKLCHVICVKPSIKITILLPRVFMLKCYSVGQIILLFIILIFRNTHGNIKENVVVTLGWGKKQIGGAMQKENLLLKKIEVHDMIFAFVLLDFLNMI